VHPLAAGRKTPAANCPDCREAAHAPASCPCLGQGRWCHSFHAATLNQERIEQWWGRHPEFGIGVSCGPAGLVVIDIDAHPAEPPARDRILPGIPIGDQVNLTGLANGYHTLAVLAALRGQPSPAEDASTLRVSTPPGGPHVWYRSTGNRRWKSSAGSTPGRALAWQVDVRAHGSYIIAPGTTTQHGTYTPVGDVREPAALPQWLAQELDRTGHLPAPTIPAPRPVPPRAQQAVLAAGGGRGPVARTLATILAPVEAFVSSNTRDFGDGTAYKWPMDADVADLGDRFLHLTKMDEVITRFAEPTDTDEELVAKTLRAANVLKAVKAVKAVKRRLVGDERLSECCFLAGFSGGELEIGAALPWVTMKAQFHSLRDVRTYRIGEHEWCTAVVRWDLAGTAFISPSTTDTATSIATAGCSWTTSVIFRPDPHDPRLTVLQHDPTRALNRDEFEKLEPSKAPAITVSMLSEYLTRDGYKLPPPRPEGMYPPPPPWWAEAVHSAFLDGELKATQVLRESARQSAIERRFNALLEEAEEG
jgi:hypothetical protein